MKRFLDSGGYVDTFGGRFHGTLLLESCRHHTDKVAELLLERGAAVNASGGGSWTPLHYACRDGQEVESVDLVSMLICHGAMVDAADFYGRTPLHIACSRRGTPEVALPLLEAGAEPNVPDRDGRTPLHYAAAQGRRGAISVLIRFGGNVSSVDRELSTPLHTSTLERQWLAMNLLERAGADANAVDCWGRLAGTLAPSYKMRPLAAAPAPADGHEEGANSTTKIKKKCLACSARNGSHYYFCESEILDNCSPLVVLGPDGLPLHRQGEEVRR